MPSHLELMNFLYPPILSDVEVIRMDQIQEAFERFVKSDRRISSVIVMKSISAA